MTETPAFVQPSYAVVPAFEIYPNPAEKELTFTGNLQESVEYCITDIQGKEVMKGFSTGRQEFSIDISTLKPGIYLFTVENSA